MTETTPRPDVPDELMRAFINGAISSPPDVKANSPEWVRNGLACALAAYEATSLAELEIHRQCAEQAEQALREEITAMAEERRIVGRASILNLIRERDEQQARADRAEAALAERDTEIERQVREQVAAEIYADQELGRVAAPYERCIRVALGRDPDGWPDDERDVNAIMATIGTVRCGLAGPHHRHTWSEQGHGRVCPGERIARGESR